MKIKFGPCLEQMPVILYFIEKKKKNSLSKDFKRIFEEIFANFKKFQRRFTTNVKLFNLCVIVDHTT